MYSNKKFTAPTGLVLLLLGAVVGCSSAPANTTAGGSGGAGGGGTVNCGSDNPDDLISDFMMDNGIHPADGRSGGWYVYGDPTPTAVFDPPKDIDPAKAYPIDMTTGNSACSGAGSLHVKATGFADWGAATGTDFKPKAGAAKGTYDATKYKGISFWAKAAMPVSFVQVKFPDVNTDDMADPSQVDPTRSACALTANFPDFNCSPYLVKLGDAAFPSYVNSKIDTTWKRFDIMFADTKQDQFNPGKDPIHMLDVAHLVSFAIQVNANYSTTPKSANNFEIWIDDVRFIR